eukprot:3293-Heterococcus_DN1.PRE.2
MARPKLKAIISRSVEPVAPLLTSEMLSILMNTMVVMVICRQQEDSMQGVSSDASGGGTSIEANPAGVKLMHYFNTSHTYVEEQASAHELSEHTTPKVMAQRLCLNDAQLPSSRCARRRCHGVHTDASSDLLLVVHCSQALSVWNHVERLQHPSRRFQPVLRDARGSAIACTACAVLSSSRGKGLSRRAVFEQSVRGASAAVLLSASPASALIKGNAPPTAEERQRRKLAQENEVKSRSMTEAYDAGERREIAMRTKAEADEVLIGEESTFRTTATGVRYKDQSLGQGAEVTKGSAVDLRYRVLKLGKRSYDGLSGEATLVFSLGYGEDDDKEGTFITVPVGGGKLISAVDEAIVGMHVGGRRRVLVRPDRDQGWKKSDPNCASLFDVGMASGIPGATIAKVRYKHCFVA